MQGPRRFKALAIDAIMIATEGVCVCACELEASKASLFGEIERVPVLLRPLAKQFHGDVVELPRVLVRFKQLSQLIPEPGVVQPQRRRELMRCTIPASAQFSHLFNSLLYI